MLRLAPRQYQNHTETIITALLLQALVAGKGAKANHSIASWTRRARGMHTDPGPADRAFTAGCACQAES